jgi:hypothetical protein
MSAQQDGGARYVSCPHRSLHHVLIKPLCSLLAASLASTGNTTASIPPVDDDDVDQNTIITVGTMEVALEKYIMPTLDTIRQSNDNHWIDVDDRLVNMEEDLIEIQDKLQRGHAGQDDSEIHVKASGPQNQESHVMKQEFRVMRQELRVMRRELRAMRREVHKSDQQRGADVSSMSKRAHINAIAARQITASARLHASKKKTSHR